MSLERIFTTEDQRWFADWSGDRNPVHLDAVAARITVAGAPVVHGIHLLLWALEEAVDDEHFPAGALGVRADFRKFVYPGQTVSIDRSRGGNGELILKLGTEHGVATVIRIGSPKHDGASLSFPSDEIGESASPAAPTFAEMEQGSGWLSPSVREARVLFPRLANRLREQRVIAIGQVSRLVGMICPGLHSILSAVDLDFESNVDGRSGIGFRTIGADERFNLIRMSVGGSGLRGTAEAFVRPPPLEPFSVAEARECVKEGQFAGRRALIVGGSRGLGAVTAKLLAAGGAQVTITFATGTEEAKAIGDETVASGRSAFRAIPLDVGEPIDKQLAALNWAPTHVYYFATPRIFAQKQASFDRALFDRFTAFYVTGFENLCTYLAELTHEPIEIFYPSSVAVTDQPKGMAEYAKAKAAGERLCEDLMRLHPNLRFSVERLPRVDTDQTRTIQRTPAASAAATMQAILNSA